ncbi:DUF6461 domain-containing protein [Streptomyces sp. NPDC014676]|uniref:DUF6461 domain-containing protein n=1 Tax=Streptomyces sp. NPDC014676 TaxID=3364879 RepID=UPI0037029B13
MGRLGASFALAERITGIRVTPEPLTSAPYGCGLGAHPWEASGPPGEPSGARARRRGDPDRRITYSGSGSR